MGGEPMKPDAFQDRVTVGELVLEGGFCFHRSAPSLDVSRLGLPGTWREDWDEKLVSARSPARYHAYLSTLAEAMRLVPGTTVLDIGCGVATELIEYSRAGVTCVGLDAAAEVVRLLAFLKCELKLDRFMPLRGDAAALPFDDASFDAVLSVHSLEHVGDQDGALTEAVRVLRPGGRLVVMQASIWNPVLLALIWWHYGFGWLRTKHLVRQNTYGDGCDQKNEDLHSGAWWRKRMARLQGIRLLHFGKYSTTRRLPSVLARPVLGHFLIVAEKT